MSNVERIRVAVLAALIVLALFAVINRKVMWVMWKNVMQGSVTFDDTKNWLGGMSYEYISYSDVSDADYLHIYVPESEKTMPLAIMVHGGGFVSGSVDSRQSQLVYRYFRDHGYAAATINYRLADEAAYPAAIEDVKAAIRFLRSNAEQYGYDADRFVVLGESAGGYLATMAAVTSDDEFMGVPFVGEDSEKPVSASVSALVDFYGIMDFAMENADWKAEGIPRLMVKLANSWMWQYTGIFNSCIDCWIQTDVIQVGSPEGMTEDMKQYCPSTYIARNLTKESDLQVLIFHGNADITVSQQNSIRLYDTLRDAIGEDNVQLVIYPGYGHASDLFFSEEHMNEIKTYLDQVL